MLRLLLRTAAISVLFAAVAPYSHACGNQAPGYGFIIVSLLQDNTGPFGAFDLITGQSLTGVFSSGFSSTKGSTSSFTNSTDGNGQLPELGKATPAVWTVGHNNGPCSDEDPEDGPISVTKTFEPTATLQPVVCNAALPDEYCDAYPSSFDTSTGIFEYTVTMTDESGPWPRNPYYYTNFDAEGNFIASGPVTVTDEYDCTMSFIANSNDSETQYIWLTDANGLGLGYATITVTDGNGGGGG